MMSNIFRTSQRRFNNINDNNNDDTTPSILYSNSSTSDTTDDGVPSNDVYSDLLRVLALSNDARHLVAYELYRDARKRMAAFGLLPRRNVSSSEKSEFGNEGNSVLLSSESSTVVRWNTTTVSTSMNTTSTGILHSFKRRFRRTSATISNNNRISPSHQHNRQFIESHSDDGNAYSKALLLIQERKIEFDTLVRRAKIFLKAKENIAVNDDWIFAQTVFGVTTYYRFEDEGSLSFKLQGDLNGVPLFEQLAVLRECDLFHLWLPFCNDSKKLKQSKFDSVGWCKLLLPILGARDGVYHAMGCDNMREDGSIIVAAEGISGSPTSNSSAVENRTGGSPNQLSSPETSPLFENSVVDNNDPHCSGIANLVDTSTTTTIPTIIDDIEIPPAPSSFMHRRMKIRNFAAAVEVLSPTCAKTCIIVNIDFNTKKTIVPQNVVDFFTKRIGGLILLRLQATAWKIIGDPKRSPHARRMRADSAFYKGWLLPKFETYCKEVGWELPPVSAFLDSHGNEYDDDDYEEDNWSDGQSRGLQSFSDNSSSHLQISTPISGKSMLDQTVSRKGKKNPFRAIQYKIDRGPGFLTPIKTSHAIERQNERKIVALRRRARKRLAAKPLNDQQQKRYNELQLTKQRINEEERQNEAFLQRRMANPKALLLNRDKNVLTPQLPLVGKNKWWEQLFFQIEKTANDIYWSAIWPVIGNLFVLFVVLYSNYFQLLSSLSIFEVFLKIEERWRIVVSFILVLSVYAVVNIFVLCSICNVAFDAIEPHLSSLDMKRRRHSPFNSSSISRMAVDVRVFHQGRLLFRRKAWEFCCRITYFVIFLCTVLECIRYGFRHYSFEIPLDFDEHRKPYNSTPEIRPDLEMIRWLMASIASFIAASIILGVLLLDPQQKRRSHKVQTMRENEEQLVTLEEESGTSNGQREAQSSMNFTTIGSHPAFFRALEFFRNSRRHSSEEEVARVEDRPSPRFIRKLDDLGTRFEALHQDNVRNFENVHHRFQQSIEHIHQNWESVHQWNSKSLESLAQRFVRKRSASDEERTSVHQQSRVLTDNVMASKEVSVPGLNDGQASRRMIVHSRTF